MNGKASIIGGVGSSQARRIGAVTAIAVTFGALTSTQAYGLAPIEGNGERTRGTGLFHWIKVTPEEPQEMVWLNPDGIDYYIETSTNLKWQIK